jgi:hypothetical protein
MARRCSAAMAGTTSMLAAKWQLKIDYYKFPFFKNSHHLSSSHSLARSLTHSHTNNRKEREESEHEKVKSPMRE